MSAQSQNVFLMPNIYESKVTVHVFERLDKYSPVTFPAELRGSEVWRCTSWVLWHPATPVITHTHTMRHTFMIHDINELFFSQKKKVRI